MLSHINSIMRCGSYKSKKKSNKWQQSYLHFHYSDIQYHYHQSINNRLREHEIIIMTIVIQNVTYNRNNTRI